MQFLTILSVAGLAMTSFANPVSDDFHPLESCSINAFSGLACSGDAGDAQDVPTSGGKCIRVGPDGYRHSLSIGNSCPQLNINEYGNSDCNGATSGSFTAGPGCVNFNDPSNVQGISVSFA